MLPKPPSAGSDGGWEVTGGPPAVEQLHRGAFKMTTGSEAQKGSGSQGSEGVGNGAKSFCLMLLWGGPGYTQWPGTLCL